MPYAINYCSLFLAGCINQTPGEYFMSHLSAIEDTVKQVARALSSALNTEVSIVDQDLMTIADTIGSRKWSKKYIDYSNIYQQVRQDKRPIIIPDPGKNSLCRDCFLYGSCPEYYEIDHPILLEDEFIGIISLMAMTEEQKTACWRTRLHCCPLLAKCPICWQVRLLNGK